MITWMRDTTGTFMRSGEPDNAREVSTLAPANGATTTARDSHGTRRSRSSKRRSPKNKFASSVTGLSRHQRSLSAKRLAHASLNFTREKKNDMPKKGKKAKKAPKAPTVKLSRFQRITLCDLVKERTELVAKFKGNELKAILDTDGVLTFAGKQFDSLSMAAKAATDGGSINGWTFWKLPNGEPIDVLRKKKAA